MDPSMLSELSLCKKPEDEDQPMMEKTDALCVRNISGIYLLADGKGLHLNISRGLRFSLRLTEGV